MFLLSFFRTAEALPAPFQNPETKYRHWFHGTKSDFENGDDDDTPPGGHIQHQYTESLGYGANKTRHWNNDLGSHFTSEHETAQQFAKGGSTWPGSRVAHVALHMANPKHFNSEFEMSRQAIKWAQGKGYHYYSDATRNDPGTDEHLKNYDLPSELPHEQEGEGSYRLSHLFDWNPEKQAKHLAIDRGQHLDEDEPHHLHGTDWDEHLAYHPEREEITQGYKDHLRSQGHDGVIYGNEYEGRKGHACAIPFDDEQVNMHHWEWLDPKAHEKNAGEPRSEKPHPDQQHLLSPSYFPGEGHHWRDHEDQHIGPMHSLLLMHFASGTPLYKQPQPKYESLPEGASDDEIIAHGDEQRAHQSRWKHEVRRAISRGDLHPEEARANGYHGEGHDQDSQGNLTWTHMPSTLWHVTTNKSGVLGSNTLKSRHELNQAHGGSGLGGGPADTISFTDDLDTAHHIHRALHEYHDALTGKKSISSMVDEAHQGGYLDTLHSHLGEANLKAWSQGRKQVDAGKMLTHDEAKQQIHPDAEFWPDNMHANLGGQSMHSRFSVPATEHEKIQHRSSVYKSYAGGRAMKGGPMDPGFIMNSPHAMHDADPSQFGIVRVHPKPGSRGYKVSALGEWRTADGSVAHIGGMEPSQHDAEGLTKQASSIQRIVHRVDGAPAHPDSGLEAGEGGDIEYWDRGDHLKVFRRVVHPDYRRQGIGTALQNRLEGVAGGRPIISDRGDFSGAAQALMDDYRSKHPESTWKTAATSDGYLENPYHDHSEWFHGTVGDFEGAPSPTAAADLHEERSRHSKGMGGPQPNKLLGTHWSALHSVAHGFAKGYKQSRIFHANLSMQNPKHFEDESAIMHHMWRWASSHPEFHDEKHNEDTAFNYGEAATSHGIDKRLASMDQRTRTGDTRFPNARNDIAHSMERYIQFHPQQIGIAKGYVQHLKDIGHDGITYGNAVEGPRHHISAITFDPGQAHVTHVDRMHPEDKASWSNGVRTTTPAEKQDGEVSHDHIASTHDEPKGLLDEVERYHNGGKNRETSSDWYSGPGRNTGRGEYKYSARALPCSLCGGEGQRTRPDGSKFSCDKCDGTGTFNAADHWDAPNFPEQQRSAIDMPGSGGREHEQRSRALLDIAKDPKPGTMIYRGEIRHKDDLDSPPSVGMHWSVNPDSTIMGHDVPEDHRPVLWEARLDHPDEQAIPRSHPVWSGIHRSLDNEAEVRLKPGANIHVTRAFVHDGEGKRGYGPSPTHSERSTSAWSAHHVGKDVPVAHKPSEQGKYAIDYSGVGIKNSMTQPRPNPDPIEYQHISPTRHPSDPEARDGGFHSIRAKDGGRMVGRLTWWDPEEGPWKKSKPSAIDKVEVASTHRRQGLAAEMFRRAAEVSPGLRHSDELTSDGHAWRDAVSPQEAGTPFRPARMNDRLGGLHGDLPDDLTFSAHYRHPEHPRVKLRDGEAWAFAHSQGKCVGGLRWNYHNEPSTIEDITVSPSHQRRGIASAMFDWVKNNHQSDLEHSDTLTDDGRAWKQSLGSVLTDWQPHERLFAPTKGTVDPTLFDADRKMHPTIRAEILDVVNQFYRRHGYGSTKGWARVYLAGSQASEWWGNRDFDILVGINYPEFRRTHPDLASLSDAEIGHQMNEAFAADFNDEDWHPKFDPQHDWHRTGYVNKDSWDIRQIKPYAAYNITDDVWAVDPIDEPTGHQFGPTEWYYFESIAEEARVALSLPEPARSARASLVWEFVHSDRSRAFGPHGTGAFDRGNALEKYLDQADSGIPGKSLMAALADARFGRKANA